MGLVGGWDGIEVKSGVEGHAIPWMLSIWPTLRAAPRTVHKVCTIRSALASDRKGLEPGWKLSSGVERMIVSIAIMKTISINTTTHHQNGQTEKDNTKCWQGRGVARMPTLLTGVPWHGPFINQWEVPSEAHTYTGCSFSPKCLPGRNA